MSIARIAAQTTPTGGGRASQWKVWWQRDTALIVGGTGMTDQDNLRERLTQIVDVALYMWTNDLETTGTDGEFVAQAIIDELGLTVEASFSCSPSEMKARVVGKWEKQ